MCHEIRLLIPSAKIKCHENSFGELAKCREIPPSFTPCFLIVYKDCTMQVLWEIWWSLEVYTDWISPYINNIFVGRFWHIYVYKYICLHSWLRDSIHSQSVFSTDSCVHEVCSISWMSYSLRSLLVDTVWGIFASMSYEWSVSFHANKSYVGKRGGNSLIWDLDWFLTGSAVSCLETCTQVNILVNHRLV